MKLSTFLVGMFASATAIAVGMLALGGTFAVAVMMWFATVLLAQVLYVLLLAAMARFSDGSAYPCWQDAGAKGTFARSGDLPDTRAKHSPGHNA